MRRNAWSAQVPRNPRVAFEKNWRGGWKPETWSTVGGDEPPNKKVDSVRVEEFLSDHGPEGAAEGAESLKGRSREYEAKVIAQVSWLPKTNLFWRRKRIIRSCLWGFD